MSNDYDVIVVGGGHNGLVAAAYLAGRACGRWSWSGGRSSAAPPSPSSRSGPDYTVTSLSYVVSAAAARDRARPGAGPARLPRLPAGPVLRAAPRTAATCSCPTTTRAAPRADREVLVQGRRRHRALGRMARRARPGARPAARDIPPKVGSRKPGRPRRPGAAARQLRGVDDAQGGRRDPAVHHRASPTCVDDFFESDAMQGVLSVSRRHRHLGRAALAGHRVRDAPPPHRRRRRRPDRRVGLPARRHGRRHQAIASAARSFGAEIRTDAAVAQITSARRRARRAWCSRPARS